MTASSPCSLTAYRYQQQLTITGGSAAVNGSPTSPVPVTSTDYVVLLHLTGAQAAAVYEGAIYTTTSPYKGVPFADVTLWYTGGSSPQQLDIDADTATYGAWSADNIALWFKLQAPLGAGPASDDHYVLAWGNAAPTVRRDWASLYPFFDDFTAPTLDPAKWTWTNGGSQPSWVSSGSGQITVQADPNSGSRGVYAQTAFGPGYAVTWRMALASPPAAGSETGAGWHQYTGPDVAEIEVNSGVDAQNYTLLNHSATVGWTWTAIAPLDPADVRDYTVAHAPDGSDYVWRDSETPVQVTVAPSANGLRPVIFTSNTNGVSYAQSAAWVKVRPWIPGEPTVTAGSMIASLCPGSGAIPWHPHTTVHFSSGLDARVDLADGHFDLSAADLSLHGLGPTLRLDHTYDSLLAQAGVASAASAGWLDSLTPRMGGVLTDTVVFRDASGATWPLTYTGAPTATAPYTSYSVPPGQPWQLTTSTAGYTLTDFLSGESWTFDAQGRYLADTDSYGNSNMVVEGPNGPTSLTNSGGRAMTLSYNANGLLNDVQSPAWGASGGQDGQHVTYGYNGLQQLTGLTWGAGTSDAITASFGYSGTQLVTVTTPAGHVWTIGYDPQGRVTSITSPAAGSVSPYTTTIAYSPTQTQVIEGAGSAQPLTTTYGLSAQGEPITLTDALGYTSTATYDADHDVLTSTDALGQQTVNSYAYAGPNGYNGPIGPDGTVGLITQTVQPPIAAYTFTNSLSPVITDYYYNQTDDLTATVGPEGSATTLYGYDSHHSVITTTQLLTVTPGLSCPTAALAQGGLVAPANRTRTLSPAANPATATLPCQYTFGWRGRVNSYDQYGELVGQTDGRGVSVATTHSAAPSPPLALPPVSLAASATQYTRHWSYSSAGDLSGAGTPPLVTVSGTTPATTTYRYTADGLLAAITSPNGNTTTNTFDHLGRLTKVVGPTVPVDTGGAGSTGASSVTLSYDGDGHLTRTRDALGAVSTAAYDPLGRVLATTNPVSGTTLYTYTATTLTAVQDPAGHVTRYSYDAAGRLISRSDPAAPSGFPGAQYGYDALGQTTAITTPLDYANPQTAAIETRGYDALGEVITATVGGVNEITPTTPQTTYTSYDHSGDPVQVQAPNGDVSYTSYDAASRPTESDLYPSAISDPTNPPPTAHQVYSYDPANNLVEQFDFTLYDHQMSYDGANHLTQRLDCLLSCPVSASPPITTTVGYDPDGNTVALTRTDTTSSSQPITATATYNAADWLTGQSDAAGTTP